MTSKAIFTQQARFKYLSELAASLERKGNYSEAANAWHKAHKEALTAKNEEWCLNRCEWCERLATRPF